jgi:hypothetical protein
VLAAIDVPLVARHPAQNPRGIESARGAKPFKDFKVRSRRERFPRDRLEPLNPPPARPGTDVRDAQRKHKPEFAGFEYSGWPGM